MKRSYVTGLLMAFSSVFLASCESTLDYGYYVDRFDDESVIELFALADQAIADRDINEYASFFGPNYTSTDASDGAYRVTGRTEYLEFADELFDTAKSLEVRTRVMDIDYTQPASEALVRVQEEEKREQFGNTQHYTSLVEYEVGFEDGWIFFLRSKRTDMQVIEE